jgi:hypothetical protein
MRFTKGEILKTFEREERSYRLALMCTHWIRDVECYAPNASALSRNLHMQVDGKWISDTDLAEILENPRERELLSSDFMLTYLHTLIRAPFELLSDYCEEFDRGAPVPSLLNQMNALHGTASPTSYGMQSRIIFILKLDAYVTSFRSRGGP